MYQHEYFQQIYNFSERGYNKYKRAQQKYTSYFTLRSTRVAVHLLTDRICFDVTKCDARYYRKMTFPGSIEPLDSNLSKPKIYIEPYFFFAISVISVFESLLQIVNSDKGVVNIFNSCYDVRY